MVVVLSYSDLITLDVNVMAIYCYLPTTLDNRVTTPSQGRGALVPSLA